MRLALALCLTFAAPAAMACSPMPFTPSEMPEVGENCQFTRYVTEGRAVGLSAITEGAGGLLMQDVFDGNACYWESNLLIQDCAAGRMMVIGPDMRDLMLEPNETGIDRIAERLATEALDFDAIDQMARAEGYATRLNLRTGTRIAINGEGLPTRCGCETYQAGSN